MTRARRTRIPVALLAGATFISAILAGATPFIAEQDSLNASILGLDAEPGTPEFDLFIKEASREITVKAGQKCTAMRRLIVPAARTGAVIEALSDRLSKTRIGDPADEKEAVGAWFWTDLFTRDANAAEAFYGELVGFQKKQLEAGEGHRYLVFNQNGKVRAGLVELQWDELEDNWLPYVEVDDVKSTVSKARELGGNVILEKDDVAILVDPTGAVFGVQAQR